MCGEAGVSPGEELLDELLGDGVAIEEPGEEPLAEQAHQEGGVPLGQADKGDACGEAPVGGEDVQMGVPLEEVAGGGEGNDETGAQVFSRCAAEKLDARLGGGPGELNEEVAPTAKQRTQ
jgi:hypothetical protein